MTSLLKIQPFKGLYLICEALTTAFIRAPIWFLLALPRSNRPRPSWPIKRVLLLKWLKLNLIVVGRAGKIWKEPNYLVLEQGPKVKGTWVPPAPPHLIIGEVKEWASYAKVETVRLPGYWLEKDGSNLPVGARPIPGEKVLYSLHGGGYVEQSAHPDNPTSNIPRGILQHAGPSMIRSFQLEYRNSRPATENPSNPFPAALLDAIAGYNYLIGEVGFTPEDIILEGDSAGANLSLALTRYLLENQGKEGGVIPRPPSGLILCSPWCDLGPEPEDRSSSMHTNVQSDFLYMLGPSYKAWTGTFFGPHGHSAGYTNRYISPASLSQSMGPVSFKGFPRTFILNAGAEILRDQIRVLRDKMQADLGSDVTFVEFPDGWHDFLAFPGFEPERSDALAAIAAWLEV